MGLLLGALTSSAAFLVASPSSLEGFSQQLKVQIPNHSESKGRVTVRRGLTSLFRNNLSSRGNVRQEMPDNLVTLSPNNQSCHVLPVKEWVEAT